MATSSCAVQSLPVIEGALALGVSSVWSRSGVGVFSCGYSCTVWVSISLRLREKAAREVGLACHGSVCYKLVALPRSRLREKCIGTTRAL